MGGYDQQHRGQKLRILIGIVKDKASIVKATLSTTKRSTKIVHIAILRATTHSVSRPPPDDRVANVLAFGNGPRQGACTCVQVLMDRLQRTKNAYVAMKCLFTIHAVVTKGSFILRDQLSFFPSSGGRNFLNLSEFRDNSDSEAWELSSWVRWYAAVVEQHLIVSRFLGYHLSSSSSSGKKKNDKEEKVLALMSRDLLQEVEGLVGFVEVICDAPESLYLQKNSLVYEVVRSVSEDYKLLQREIFVRVAELGDRVASLSFAELTQLLGGLTRLLDSRRKLCLLFVNRKRNDALWELVSETKMKALEMLKKGGDVKGLLTWRTAADDSGELARFGEQFIEFGQLTGFRSGDRGGVGLGLELDLVPLTVSTTSWA